MTAPDADIDVDLPPNRPIYGRALWERKFRTADHEALVERCLAAYDLTSEALDLGRTMVSGSDLLDALGGRR